MSARPFARASEIFLALRELDPASQARSLAEAQGLEPDVRRLVEDLLEGARHPIAALDHPWIAVGPCDVDPVPERIGSFQILGPIGPGGMGMVYRAQQESPKRVVALKVIRPSLLTEENRGRFLGEIEKAGRLEHPGIARVYAGGSEDGPLGPRPYFAMEYVEGVPLTRYADDASLGLSARMRLLEQVCEAVQHAHQKGMIHCDLKPANILVDASGRPRILDFGIARWRGERPAGAPAGAAFGTPAYMSPEQRRGEEPDTRWDVYALGELGLRLARLEGERCTLPSSSSAQRIDARAVRELVAVLGKARAEAREQRYESAAAFAEDLRRWIQGEPTTAFEGGRWHRWELFRRRNRKLVATLALAQAFLVVGVFGTSWQWRRATLAATRAEQEATKKQAALEFLGEVFRLAQPEGALGEELTMANVLARSEEFAPRVLADQPEVLAQVRALVGNAYAALGRHGPAERNLVLARDALAQIGETLPATLEVELDLASVLGQAERRDEARALLERTLERTTSTLGPEHRLTLRARYELGSRALAEGRWTEADTHLQEVLRIQLAELGPSHRETLMTRGTLGTLRSEEGRREEAAVLLQETLVGMREALGPTHPLTLTTLGNLATLLGDLERYEEALLLAREELAAAERVMGRDHPHLLLSRGNVAVLVGWRGELAESERLLREVLGDCDRLVSPAHPVALLVRHNLTDVLWRAGKFSEAAKEGRATLDGRCEILGPAHEHTLLTRELFCEVLRQCGRLDEAVRELRRGLEDVHASPATGADRRVTLLNDLARCLIALDDLDEAEVVLGQALDANPGGTDELAAQLEESRGLEHELERRLQAATR